MSRFKNQVLLRSSAGKWRSAKPWIPPWRTSSAPQETSSTRSPSTGCALQPLGERDQHGDRAEVVVGARAHGPSGDVGEHGRRRAASRAGRRGSPAPTARGAERDQRRRAHHRPPQRQRRVDPLDHARERLAEPRLRLVVEDRAGRCGVVMGKDDERALRRRGRRTGDHVPGRAQRRRGAAEEPRSVGDVVGDRGGHAAPLQRRRACACAAAAPRRRRPRRPPPASPITRAYPSWNCSSSIVRLAAGLLEALRRSSARPVPRLRAGAALERSERLDDLSQGRFVLGADRRSRRVECQGPRWYGAGGRRAWRSRAGVWRQGFRLVWGTDPA